MVATGCPNGTGSHSLKKSRDRGGEKQLRNAGARIGESVRAVHRSISVPGGEGYTLVSESGSSGLVHRYGLVQSRGFGTCLEEVSSRRTLARSHGAGFADVGGRI